MWTNWSFVAIGLVLLLLGYSAYTYNQATEKVDSASENLSVLQRCYNAGYDAATYGEPRTPPEESEKCADSFEAGFSEGRRVSGGVRWDLSGLTGE